jgi:hypothetical protein
MGQIREAPRPDLREVRAETPPAAADALCRGLARDPDDRQLTAGALVDELEAAFAKRHAPSPSPVAPPDPPTAVLEPVPVAAASPPPAPHRGRRRGGLLAAAALAAVAAAVVAIVLIGGGGEDEPSREEARTPAASTTGDGARRAEQEVSGEPRADGSSPEAAVRGFYTRAAEGDLDGAWRLAGPRMRAEFGGSRERFEDTLGSLRGIEFRRLTETARSGGTATVEIETVAQHTTRTDRCTGALGAVRRGEGWRVEPQGVRCTSG